MARSGGMSRRILWRRHGAGRPRVILAALAAVGLPALAAGCSFESQIAVQFLGGAPVVVKQSTKVDVTPQRVRGTTTRAGQVVRIDCSITGIYDVDDPTGPAVLVQLYVVHLRTRPLPRGTPYQLDCAGPVIVELPTDASDIQATATDASGLQVALPVQAPLSRSRSRSESDCGRSPGCTSPSWDSLRSQPAPTRPSSPSASPRPARSGRR